MITVAVMSFGNLSTMITPFVVGVTPGHVGVVLAKYVCSGDTPAQRSPCDQTTA
jgi:hypothetical protein